MDQNGSKKRHFLPQGLGQDMTPTSGQTNMSRLADKRIRFSYDVHSLCRDAEDAVMRFDATYAERKAGLERFLSDSEAMAYSWVKRVDTGLDDVAIASIGTASTKAAGAVVAASQSLNRMTAQAGGGSFPEQAVLDAHEMLFASAGIYSRQAGHYRKRQTWTGGPGLTRPIAIQPPPPASRISELMADLFDFVNRNDIPALAQAALAHGQFEAIHPFDVGNGRLSRALVSASIRRREVSHQLLPPIGAAIAASSRSYFALLQTYRAGNFNDTIAFTAQATLQATKEATLSVEHLLALPQKWRDLVRPRARSGAAALIDALIARPVLDSSSAQRLISRSAPRTFEALDRLVDAEVLREVTGGERYRIWIATDVFSELADLGARLREHAPRIG